MIPTVRLNHPNGCVGYRVNYGGQLGLLHHRHRACARPRTTSSSSTFLNGADIMIYDCMYTDAEFDHYRGYGHSTWEEGVRLCEAAGVKRLVIFHHRPGRDDEDLRQIEAEAQARFPGAIVAAHGP